MVVAASPLAANGRRDAALLAGDEDASSLGVVAAVAAIDIGALDLDAGDPLGLGDLGGQGVAVIGVAGQGAGAEDELAARCGGVGGGDRDLHVELVAGLGLALADALHLRGVQGVELVAAVRGNASWAPTLGMSMASCCIKLAASTATPFSQVMV